MRTEEAIEEFIQISKLQFKAAFSWSGIKQAVKNYRLPWLQSLSAMVFIVFCTLGAALYQTQPIIGWSVLTLFCTFQIWAITRTDYIA